MVTPSWGDKNLERHHAKRLRETPGCFEELLGLTGRPMTVEEYRNRSEKAVGDSWCEYDSQGRDIEQRTYLELRACYVDADLVVAVTDVPRASFVTCFTSTSIVAVHCMAKTPGNTVSFAQRRLRYLDDLRIKEKGRLIINMRVIRDGQPQK